MAHHPGHMALTIPFMQPVPGNIRPGLSVHLRGSTPPDAKFFTIDLQEGPKVDPDSDSISLQLYFNFMKEAVYRSTWDAQRREWEPTGEDAEFDGGMPINRGYEFDVVVRCQRGNFCITVNEEVFCVYYHRRNPGATSHVHVDGDVALQLFEIL